MNEKNIKLLLMGGVGAALGVLLISTSIFPMFKSSEKEKISNDPIIDSSLIPESDEELKQESIYQDKESIEKIDEVTADSIKTNVWNAILLGEIENAAKEMVKAYKEYEFTEENELLNWHVDVNALSVLEQVPQSQRYEILTTFKTPRFVAAFSVFASPLVTSSIISDPESLIPIDINSINLLAEGWIVKEDFNNEQLTNQIETMKAHAEKLYYADLIFNETERVRAYVSIMKDGSPKLIGYYGENINEIYKTDKYWEDNRVLFSNIPILNQ